MNVPANLKYTSDHEWIKVEGDIETEGDNLEKGDVFGTVEAVKTVSDLFMPLKGEVVEVNENIESAPESVNDSPYEDGWMIKVKIEDMSELDNLLSAEAYQAEIS